MARRLRFEQVRAEFERLREQDATGSFDREAHARFRARTRELAERLRAAHDQIHRKE